MVKFDKLIENRTAQNIFIWIFLYVIFLGSIQSDNIFLTAFYTILFLAPPVYVNNLFILPYFKKNKLTFLILFLINAFLFTSILVVIMVFTSMKEFKLNLFYNFFGLMLLTLIFGATIKIARDSFVLHQQEREAELRLLKGQLNPHFLFNTLNNLYGLSVIKSDKLPDLMLKLSDLLRYSLYETKETFVPLKKEISYLENYISLEKIRLEDKTNIIFHKSGEVFDKKIAPMLLIVFVENAFKHLDIDKNKLGNVQIKLSVVAHQLFFRCSNSFDYTAQTDSDMESSNSGIGLQNAKKRLDLIYPDTHQLKIEQEEQNYIVELILDLS